MSNLGMGVMLNMLSSNKESVELVKESLGKEIEYTEVINDQLRFSFKDGTIISLFDDGQSCCESRYMSTDDDLSHFSGSKLQDIEIREGNGSAGDYYQTHDTEFLVVTTDKGSFTVVNHNEHNGYYGGFYIKAEKVRQGKVS